MYTFAKDIPAGFLAMGMAGVWIFVTIVLDIEVFLGFVRFKTFLCSTTGALLMFVAAIDLLSAGTARRAGGEAAPEPLAQFASAIAVMICMVLTVSLVVASIKQASKRRWFPYPIWLWLASVVSLAITAGAAAEFVGPGSDLWPVFNGAKASFVGFAAFFSCTAAVGTLISAAMKSRGNRAG